MFKSLKFFPKAFIFYVETILSDGRVLLNNFLGLKIDLIIPDLIFENYPNIKNVVAILVFPKVHILTLLNSVDLENLRMVTSKIF